MTSACVQPVERWDHLGIGTSSGKVNLKPSGREKGSSNSLKEDSPGRYSRRSSDPPSLVKSNNVGVEGKDRSKMGPLKITLVFGSVREGRFGTRISKYLINVLEGKGHKVFYWDPEERQFPLLRKPFHHYVNPDEAPQYLKDVRKEILTSDAFVVVAAEYNHSMPPALVNALDHFHPDDYRHKPCGIVTYSYGNFGGVRAAMQLRCFLGELGMITPSYIFAVPKVLESFSEEGEPQNDYMIRGAESLITELEWYGSALKEHTDKHGPPK